LTTIAYRDGTISADTRISYSSFRNGSRDKLALTKHYIVALAGSTCFRGPLEQWANEGCPEDAVPDCLLENDGEVPSDARSILTATFSSSSAGFLVPVLADYAAIGSGAYFAYGAMAHGANAAEAVAAAALHDHHTGGNIQSLHHTVLRS
jgi:hypothetical protein